MPSDHVTLSITVEMSALDEQVDWLTRGSSQGGYRKIQITWLTRGSSQDGYRKIQNTILKLYGYSCRGSNCCFLFLPAFSMGVQPLKERICFSWSKFFPIRVDSVWKVFAGQKSKE